MPGSSTSLHLRDNVIHAGCRVARRKCSSSGLHDGYPGDLWDADGGARPVRGLPVGSRVPSYNIISPI